MIFNRQLNILEEFGKGNKLHMNKKNILFNSKMIYVL